MDKLAINCQRTKDYIKRMKDEMGEKEYNDMMAEKKRLYRKSLKGSSNPKDEIQTEIIIHEPKQPKLQKQTNLILYNIFKNMTTKQDKPIRDITVKNYVDKLDRVCVLTTGHHFENPEDFEFLNNHDSVKEALLKSKITNLKDMITPIVRLLKHLNISQELISKYNEDMKEFKDIEYDKRAKNLSSDQDKDNIFDLEEAKMKIVQFKPINGIQELYKVILSIYLCRDVDSMVPRNDLSIIKLVSSTKRIRDLNQNYNYLQIKEGIPSSFIMLNYKTCGVYGPLKFNVSSAQKEILFKFIKSKQNGDFLFTLDNRELDKEKMAELIKQAGKSILNVPNLTIDRIRRTIATNFWKDGLHNFESEQLNSRNFMHSTKINREYVRRDLVDA